MATTRGSQWARWDLQIHTPASFVHCYPGNGQDDKWDRFLADLAGLPPEFEVIAVCDYIFLDGYRRVRQAWENGVLPNLKLILPAAEFRLSSFGGTDSQLRRINAQVIFSDELSPDTIEAQFHAALQRTYELAKRPEGYRWQAVVTPESLRDLGQALIDAAPESERHRYESPMVEGFNNINLSLEQIKNVLDSSHYLRDRHLLALCKTEWDSVKWNSQSIAEKRNLINSPHLVVMSAKDPAHHARALAKLQAANVNDLLLDTSDAHYPRTSDQKDRLGNCFTWIKSEPTFKGLLHALREHDRIFVGDEPAKRRLLRTKPHIFLDSVAFQRDTQGDFSEVWFDDIRIPLSPDLVSIIGNRGMGKSALAESIALAGGSTIRREHLSFLNEDRFCQRKNPKARHFNVEIQSVGGVASKCRLDATPGQRTSRMVWFLPQNYLEQICADREALGGFVAELDAVVYSHVPEAEKLWKATLKELVRHLTVETEQELGRLRLELHQVNQRIIERQDKLTPEYRKRLRSAYESCWQDLRAARERRPARIPEPSGDPRLDQRIASKRVERQNLAAILTRATELHRELKSKQAAAARMRERLKNLESELRNRLASWVDDLELLGLSQEQLVTFSVHTLPLVNVLDMIRQGEAVLQRWTDPDQSFSLVNQGAKLDREVKQLRDRLEAPSRRYQTYLEELETWRGRIRGLIGDEMKPDSLRFLRKELEALKDVVLKELEQFTQDRRRLCLQILEHIEGLRDRYRALHEAVSDFISKHPALREKLGLEFAVGTEVEGLRESFFALVHHGRSGAFYGRDAAASTLGRLVEGHDFEESSSSLIFAEEVLALLETRPTDPEQGHPPSLNEQLMDGRDPVEVLDLLFGFEYLKPHYVLKMKGRDLKSLSPGERGLLLLVFYLLVSKDSRPLIIDQPEGNLDNESIVDVLVPCIRQAKKTRQIILVTHNPNLAVVCDSEQIIRASIDSDNGFKVTYESGAIENTRINKWLVDVLEGTWPAFTTRRDSYFKPTGTG